MSNPAYTPLDVQASSRSVKLSPRSVIVTASSVILLVVGIVAIAQSGHNSSAGDDSSRAMAHVSSETQMDYMPTGSCGSTVSTYDPQTRNSISGIEPGTGYPVAGHFATVAPAVSFTQAESVTASSLNCQTRYMTTTSSTQISNSLNLGLSLSGSSGTGASGSASDQFAYNDNSAANAAYAMLSVTCQTPMLRSTGASMTSTGAEQCTSDYMTFRNTQGQCFASALMGASSLNIVISTSASSVEMQSSNEAKLQGALSATPEDASNGAGAANISTSISEALDGTSATVTSYSFGLNNQNYNFAGVTSIAQIADALEALPGSYQPQVIAVQTEPYHTIDSNCVIQQAGCLSSITTSYQQYDNRLSQIITAYENALANPAEYSHTSWQIYIYVDLFHYQYHKESAPNGACVPNPRGGCRNPQTGDNGGWRGYLGYNQGLQTTLHSWWEDFNNGGSDADNICDGSTSFNSILSDNGLPTQTYLDDQLDFVPSNQCPQSGTLNQVNAVGLSQHVGGTYNGWYQAPVLCCPGGMTLQDRANAITCACSAPAGCSHCDCQ